MINPYYQNRINTVMDFIEENLDQDLSLEKLAKVASFSKYHFHRLFKAVQGETLNHFTKRLKMEKACREIVANPIISLTQLAYDLGYQSSANFSRDFQSYYHKAPSEIKSVQKMPVHKNNKDHSKLDMEFMGVERLPDMNILYKRVSTGYDPAVIGQTFQNLYKLLAPNHLMQQIPQSIGIGYDDPDFTPLDKCRYDAGLVMDTLPPKAMGELNTKKIKGGQFAVFLFTGIGSQFAAAWDSIFNDWVINSEYIPTNNPHFELYIPSDRYKDGIYKAKLCLPVKPLPN